MLLQRTMGAGLSLETVEDVVCCRSEQDGHERRISSRTTKRGGVYGGHAPHHVVHPIGGRSHTGGAPVGGTHTNAPPSPTRATQPAAHHGSGPSPGSIVGDRFVGDSEHASYHYAGGCLSGNLFKRGEWNSSYQERFFMINPDEKRIYYYEDWEHFTHGKKSKGHIDIQGCSVEPVKDFERKQHEEEWHKSSLHHRPFDPAEVVHKTYVRQDPQALYFEFVIRNQQRTFELASKHGKEREEWIATILRFALCACVCAPRRPIFRAEQRDGRGLRSPHLQTLAGWGDTTCTTPGGQWKAIQAPLATCTTRRSQCTAIKLSLNDPS